MGSSSPPGEAHRRSVLGRSAAVLFGVLLAVLTLELISVRVSDRWLTDLGAWQTSDLPVHRVADDVELLYELRPDTDWTRPDGRRVLINSLGFRDTERHRPRRPDVPRILCLGGSNTYGADVGQKQTWPAALERRLIEETGREHEVWNLGVSGYELRQKLHVARRALTEFDPDVLILQIFNTGPRYMLQGDRPARWLRQDPRFLTEWHQLAEPPAAPRWLLRWSSIPRLLWLAGVRRLVSTGTGNDGDAVLRSWQAGLEDLRSFRDALPPDVRLITFVTPAGYQEYSKCPPGGQVPASPAAFELCDTHTKARQMLRATGVDLLDLTTEDVPNLGGIRDAHPGPAVYRFYARRLAQELIAPDR